MESDTLIVNVDWMKIKKSINEVRQRIEELENKKTQQSIPKDSSNILNNQVVTDSNDKLNELIASLKVLKDKQQSVSDIETHFGWIIQPRLTESTTSSEKIEYRQIPGHYSLSAIISIPSWWRTLKVQVNKCWLSNPTLSTSNSSLCNQKDIPPAFSIKVPGNTHDINQKLGFEVLKTPYIVPDDVGQKQELEVGRNGVVLLNGERLWRSTVIMLGSQKADSIEVLPDMKAVMATFKCVNPAAGDMGSSPENCKSASQPGESNPKQDCNGQAAIIKLWTSEGNTNNAAIAVKLKPFVRRFPTDKPCYEFEENKQARKSDDS